jgi:hypothetical protein
VEEDDRHGAGAALGGQADVGYPGTGRELPEVLFGYGSRRELLVAQREQGHLREQTHEHGAGAEQQHAGAPPVADPDLARDEHHPTRVDHAERGERG